MMKRSNGQLSLTALLMGRPKAVRFPFHHVQDHSSYYAPGTLHPRFVVQATGHSGEKKFPSHIKGISDFKGDVLCHSSEFKGAKKDSQGKKAIVVGCCNSGHDIAQDFYENGYDIILVQRSSTYVMSSNQGLDVLLGGLYDETGVCHSPFHCPRHPHPFHPSPI